MEPTLDRQDSDESKTFDNSVLIHPDNAPIATSAIAGAGSRSVPASIFRMKSPGSHSSDHQSNALGPQLSLQISNTSKPFHRRQASVSTKIPKRLHGKMPSLIQFLDTGNLRMPLKSMAINPMRHSRSVPDPDNESENGDVVMVRDQSPIPMTKDDDGAITPHSTAKGMFSSSVTPDGGTLARQSQEMTLTQTDLKLEHQPSSEDSELRRKRNEYEEMIPTAKINHEQMVDMQKLARMAAEEFASLANDNERYFKENATLKMQLAEMRVDKGRVEEELNRYKSMHETDADMEGDIDVLKSEAAKWEMEKSLLIQQIAELKTATDDTVGHSKGVDSLGLLNGGTPLKLKPQISADTDQFMKEQLALTTREKNEMEAQLEDDKAMKRQYEIEISNLRKQLKDSEERRRVLNQNLEKQQNLYVMLQENTKRKAMEIDDFVGRTRAMTLEEAQKKEKEQNQLLAAIDEQKDYIEQLESENRRLLSTKLREDDLMFNDLEQYKHRFARSVQLGSDAVSDLADSDYAHSRMASESLMSNPFFSAITSRRAIVMDGMDEEYTTDQAMELDTEAVSDGAASEGDGDEDMATPQPETAKKVKFDTAKEAEQRNMRKQKQKAELRLNAEIEFFLLTAIAVKNNLVEEYPEKTDLMTENAMNLYKAAVQEHVAMNKFNLWIEYKLREKYDLPKLEGFQKFLSQFHFKAKTEKLGTALRKSTDNLSARIRGISSISKGSALTIEQTKVGDHSSNSSAAESNGQTLNVPSPTHEAGTDSTGTDGDDPPNLRHQPCCIVM